MTLLSSYTDMSGLFTLEPEDEEDEDDIEGEAPGLEEQFPPSTEWPRTKTEAEEEDELLYGDIESLTNKEKSVHRYTYIHIQWNL